MTGERSNPPLAAGPPRRPRAERGPTVHGLGHKAPPPTAEHSKRRKRDARKAEAQAAFRKLAGLPEQEPAPLPPTPSAAHEVRTSSVFGAIQAAIDDLVTPTLAPQGRGAAARASVQTSGTSGSPQRRPWSANGLRQAVTEGWFERDNLALFMYMDSRDLVLDFKDGHPAAVTEVLAWFAGTMRQITKDLRTHKRLIALAAPRHSVGGARPSAEELLQRLAERTPWLEHLPGALQRTVAVSSGYHDGLRPDEDRHAATIRYVGPAVDAANVRFILFDDVFTSGRTSRACRRVLTEATGVRAITGLYITKTSARRAWNADAGTVRRTS